MPLLRASPPLCLGKALLPGETAFHALWGGGEGILAARSGEGGIAGFSSCFLLPIPQGERPAVALAAAHALAVGLVQLPIAAAVVALEEGFLHALHRQVQAPILAVYGDVHKAAQGGVHPKGAHQLVAQVVFQHGVVLNQVVQAQLVQAVVSQGVVVVVELHLKAVAAVAVLLHLGQGGVSLPPDGHVFINKASFAVCSIVP